MGLSLSLSVCVCVCVCMCQTTNNLYLHMTFDLLILIGSSKGSARLLSLCVYSICAMIRVPNNFIWIILYCFTVFNKHKIERLYMERDKLVFHLTNTSHAETDTAQLSKDLLM